MTADAEQHGTNDEDAASGVEDRGPSYFDIGDAWHTASETERLASNQHFLDVIISRAETVRLSIPRTVCRPDSWTAAEIRYLEKHGYVWADESTMKPPSKPS